jgi:hypothetical protein
MSQRVEVRYHGYQVVVDAREVGGSSGRFMAEIYIKPHTPPEVGEFEASVNTGIEWRFDSRERAIDHALRETRIYLDRLVCAGPQ